MKTQAQSYLTGEKFGQQFGTATIRNIFSNGQVHCTRWAPTSCNWGEITPISGVTAPVIPLQSHLQWPHNSYYKDRRGFPPPCEMYPLGKDPVSHWRVNLVKYRVWDGSTKECPNCSELNLIFISLIWMQPWNRQETRWIFQFDVHPTCFNQQLCSIYTSPRSTQPGRLDLVPFCFLVMNTRYQPIYDCTTSDHQHYTS